MLNEIERRGKDINYAESPIESYFQKYFKVIDILIIISCIFGNKMLDFNFLVYFLAVYLTIRVLFSSPEYTFTILLLLIPNLGIIYMSVMDTPIPVLNVLICIALVKVIILYTEKYFDKNYIIIIIVFVIVYEWSHAVYYDLSSIILLISWSAAVLYASIYFISSDKVYNHCVATKYFIVGLFISTIYGIFEFYTTYGTLMNNNMTIRFEGGSGDPNYYSMYVLIAVFSMLYLVKKGTNRFTRYLYPILFVFFIGFGVLSLSRMFLIVILFLLFLLFTKILLTIKENEKLIVFALIVSVISMFFAIYFNKEFNSVFNLLFSRFSTTIGDPSALTSDRNVLAEEYIKLMISNPMDMTFGIGIQNYHLRSGLIPFEAHNIILEVFIVWGLFGFLVFGLFIFTLIRYGAFYSKSGMKNIIGWLPIICLGISYLSINAMSTESFFLLLIFTIKNLTEYN